MLSVTLQGRGMPSPLRASGNESLPKLKNFSFLAVQKQGLEIPKQKYLCPCPTA